MRIAALERAEIAAVEPEGAAGDAREERAVVADDEDRAVIVGEVALEPLDRRQVEVVGRLVEQQHVRLADQRAGERGAPGLAAGQVREQPRPVKLQARQHGIEPVPFAVIPQAFRNVALHRRVAGDGRFLRQVSDGRAGLDEALARIEFYESGERLEQCRFAAPVAADQAGALAACDSDRQCGKKRALAERDGGVLEGDDRRRHAIRWQE